MSAAAGIELQDGEDDIEACFARGWSDGLPVVPPTRARVDEMLALVDRPRDESIGAIPPSGVLCSVETMAINAVMAGCRPEYLPVVSAALRAMLSPAFNAHGVLCTTYAVGPVVIVNGPIASEIAMNPGINVLGQGNRANSTIGRALQLIVRNVGGGKPGELDRATFGHPGKLGWSFAELEVLSPWEPLSVERGIAPGRSAVTVFAGEAPRAAIDEHSRTAPSLARSLAMSLRTVGHPKKVQWLDALLVVGPQHASVFRDEGWSKQRLRSELVELLTIPAEELMAGAGGCDQHMTDLTPGSTVRKFDPSQLLIVHAGGAAGPTSMIVGGWLRGELGGSSPVTVSL